MGWASRANPHTTEDAKRLSRQEARLRGALALFPDRATFEQWATTKALTDEQRGHLERFLPSRLQPQGTV